MVGRLKGNDSVIWNVANLPLPQYFTYTGKTIVLQNVIIYLDVFLLQPKIWRMSWLFIWNKTKLWNRSIQVYNLLCNEVMIKMKKSAHIAYIRLVLKKYCWRRPKPKLRIWNSPGNQHVQSFTSCSSFTCSSFSKGHRKDAFKLLGL